MIVGTQASTTDTPNGEVALVLDYAADDETAPGQPGDRYRIIGAVVRVHPAECDDILAWRPVERKGIEIDAMMEGGHVVQLGAPIQVGDRHADRDRAEAGKMPGPENHGSSSRSVAARNRRTRAATSPS